jgi:hypothetical protein
MPAPRPPGAGVTKTSEPDRERQAREARRKLVETERDADAALGQAEDELKELTEEQEATADRLRKDVRKPSG